MMISFGFIGCGNMGGTLAIAVAKSTENVAVSDRSAEAVNNITAACGAKASSNTEIAEQAQFVVLGVKPQVLPTVLAEIAPVLKARTDRFVLISMAAGVKIETVTATVGAQVPIIRIMPNTPAAIGKGTILYTCNDAVTEEEKKEFESAFTPAGEIIEIAEGLIDAASAVSGCGPAFAYLFIEALADGGVRCGLPRDLAQKLAAQTVSGSADMVLLSGKHPGALKDAVCSPAGSTIEGVEALEKGAFRGVTAEAVTTAFKRTKELG